jgi:DNA-binding response OmpR family regulator
LSNVLVLTSSREPAAEILPSLSLLPHVIRVLPADAEMAATAPPADAVLVDARRDLVQVRQLFRQLRGSGNKIPVLAIVTEGGWAAVTAEWGADDLILHTAGPGEVEARLRLAIGRMAGREPAADGEVRSGELIINEVTYSARIHGRALDLTFKEFELLKFLAQHPRRVFTRSQLLQEVWGYDYFGGTRTVDVHVRRLRAKLGAENEALIGTVRNVGYRFVPAKIDGLPADAAGAADQQPGSPRDQAKDERQGRTARPRRADRPAQQASGAQQAAGGQQASGISQQEAHPAHADR